MLFPERQTPVVQFFRTLDLIRSREHLVKPAPETREQYESLQAEQIDADWNRLDGLVYDEIDERWIRP